MGKSTYGLHLRTSNMFNTDVINELKIWRNKIQYTKKYLKCISPSYLIQIVLNETMYLSNTLIHKRIYGSIVMFSCQFEKISRICHISIGNCFIMKVLFIFSEIEQFHHCRGKHSPETKVLFIFQSSYCYEEGNNGILHRDQKLNIKKSSNPLNMR